MKWHNESIRVFQKEKDDTSWKWQQGLDSLRLMNNSWYNWSILHIDDPWTMESKAYCILICKMSFVTSQQSIKESLTSLCSRAIQMPWTLSNSLELKIWKNPPFGGENVWVWLSTWSSASCGNFAELRI